MHRLAKENTVKTITFCIAIGGIVAGLILPAMVIYSITSHIYNVPWYDRIFFIGTSLGAVASLTYYVFGFKRKS